MLLYEQGNLYKGYPFGVEVSVGWFGCTELHGPFGSENAAHNYGMAQVLCRDEVTNAKVVKIETPAVGRSIIETDGDREIILAQRAKRKEAKPDWIYSA